MNSTSIVAEDIIQNAIDFIGNDPERFGADRNAIDTIRNNENFKKVVIDEIASFPEEYAELQNSQEESANFVWNTYKDWAY